MKNLANCKPSEFLRQTNKIRKSVDKWLTLTDIKNIRKNLPDLPEGISKEEKDKLMFEQGKKNLNQILDNILELHPDETLELLALLCFVEPEDVDNHTVIEYLESFNEIIGSKEVISFFGSLMQLANITI
jgi:hypothetical protein